MVPKGLTIVFVGFMLLSVAALTMADVPDPSMCTVEMRSYAGTGTLSLFNLPNGRGQPPVRAFVLGGGIADAAITVTVRDGSGAPVPSVTFEDVWIECSWISGTFAVCGGIAVSDRDTDVNGETTFRNPLLAGGWCTGPVAVFLSGDYLGDINLRFNSGDINGDLVTNLTDGGFFTAVLFGAHSYSADFNYDGSVNITDAGYMSAGLGATCP